MAFVDSTFFGEVCDLRSRAVWSDSEEEDGGDDNVQETEVKVETRVLEPAFRASQILYVMSRSFVANSNPKSPAIDFLVNGKVFAQLFPLDSLANWLVIDDALFKVRASVFARRAILFKTLFNRAFPSG